MAEDLSTSIPKLKSYERGLVPLPYSFAAKLCRTFFINPAWLAEGRHPINSAFPIDPIWDSQFRQRQLFSNVYDANIRSLPLSGNDLKNKIEEVLAKQSTPGMEVEIIRGIGMIDVSTILALVSKTLEPLVKSLPPPLRMSFYRYVVIGFDEFEKLHWEEINQFREQLGLSKPRKSPTPIETQDTLDKNSGNSNTADVKANRPDIKSLPELLDKVRAKINQRGQKTALANELGVSRQAVDQWLSGDAKPSADLTFKLLNWVKQ